MDVTSFLLIVFHLACSSAMGVVAGLQFVHYLEYEAKKIKKYSYLGYFITIFFVIFFQILLADLDFRCHFFFDDLIKNFKTTLRKNGREIFELHAKSKIRFIRSESRHRLFEFVDDKIYMVNASRRH